ncbi:hypothetical protein [Streptomyces sp. NPDC000410]|uniref:hypothetical protein n=1 Tax=Streptomyces sp. NPDC000410 TaxID=3154254 RepID=UPI003329C01A
MMIKFPSKVAATFAVMAAAGVAQLSGAASASAEEALRARAQEPVGSAQAETETAGWGLAAEPGILLVP